MGSIDMDVGILQLAAGKVTSVYETVNYTYLI